MILRRIISGPIAGAALLATGRQRGIERFGDTVPAFLASLAPLVAFPLVGAILLVLSGSGAGAFKILLVTLVAQLAPPVVSHVLARRWGREAEWLRYATAFNWCQWVIPVVGFLFLLVLQLGAGGGMNDEQAAELLVVGLGLYALWLQWIIARAGLGLGGLRAVGLVFLVNIATLLLILVPRLLVVMPEVTPGVTPGVTLGITPG